VEASGAFVAVASPIDSVLKPLIVCIKMYTDAIIFIPQKIYVHKVCSHNSNKSQEEINDC